MMNFISLVGLLHLPLFPHLVESGTSRSDSPTYQLVYQDIQVFVSCFRRFNGTHEIGCSTSMYGNVGTVHYVNSTDSLQWLIENGPHQPYIPILPSVMFTGVNVKKLLNSKKINGLMVALTDPFDKDNYPPEGFSSDLQCPNEGSSMYKEDDKYSCNKFKFNPSGNGLMFEDIKIPMMVLKNASEVEKIINCFLSHNMVVNETAPTYPLCSVELKSFMHGAGNTEICWRRNSMIRNFSPEQYCVQLGGKSSHTFLVDTPKDTQRNKTIIITTRSDAFSLYEYTQPGASSPAPSLAAIMAITEALRPYKQEIANAGYNILVLAITGESFDYIGSQKIVYDMKLGYFPNKTVDQQRMSLNDIHLIIELSQLLGVVKNGTLYAHSDPRTKDKHSSIEAFITILTEVGISTGLTVRRAKSGQPLPPASAHMFIRENGTYGLPAVVLADYDSSFQTKFYNSYLDNPVAHGFFDDLPNIKNMYDNITKEADRIAQVASLISNSVLKLAAINVSFVSASNRTVNHVMYCLLINPKCELFYTVLPPDYIGMLNSTSSTFPFYVGVYSSPLDNVQRLVLQMLAYFSGSVVQATSDGKNCTSFWMNGPLVNGSRENICVVSNAQLHNASSPAFDDENYNFTSDYYSTWTESVWPANDPFHIKLFLRPSTEVQLASLVAGISLFIASFVCSILVYRKSNILFPPHVFSAEQSLET